MLGMSQVELLIDQELYNSFIKLPAAPTDTWVRGRVVNRYAMAWWIMPFDVMDYKQFTTTFPDCNKIREMVIDHFAQLVSVWHFHNHAG